MADQPTPETGRDPQLETKVNAARVDRFDRRFSVEGDPLETLKVVLADNSHKMF